MAIASNFPSSRPSLLLDFASVGRLDPRVTFTRASSGTYYDGVTTAKAEENLVLQSQTFATTWTTVAASVTDNTDNAPDGTATADSLFEQASTNTHRIAQSLTLVSGQTYTVSVFAKQILDREFQIAFAAGDVSGNPRANFDLTNGTLGTVDSGLTATISASTNGFYRCSVTFTAADSSFILWLSIITEPTAARSESYAGDNTKGVILWGAQVEQRSAVTAYTATTTQPITNYIPVLQTAAAGVARFDHNPTTGEALGLLIEEQRANLLTYSEDFSDSDWTKTNSSITSNTIVAPDATLTGDKLVENTSTSTHGVSQDATVVDATTYTFSCYAKLGERTKFRIRFGTSGGGGSFLGSADFDLSAGTVDSSSITSASITAVGNGWYRCVATDVSSGTTLGCAIFLIETGTTTSYTGDGYSGIYIWGADLEAGAFPTSYISTTSASVTRNADAASMTGTNFSDWYNAGEGTVYAEAATNGTASTGGIFRLVNVADSTRRIRLSYVSGTTINFGVTDSTTQVGINLVTGLTVGSFNKGAIAYKVDDFAGSANGLTALTDTAGTVPAGIDQFVIGQDGAAASTILNGTIRKLAFYPQRLSDAQLQALTG